MINGVQLRASDYDPMHINRNFYRNVKACCAILDLKIGELEREAGLTAGYLSRFRGDKTLSRRPGNMYLSNACKIAALLRLPLDYLLADQSDKERFEETVRALNRVKKHSY